MNIYNYLAATDGFKAFSKHAIVQEVNYSEKYLKYLKYSYKRKDHTWKNIIPWS